MLTLKVYTDPGHEDGLCLVATGADLPALLEAAYVAFEETYEDAPHLAPSHYLSNDLPRFPDAHDLFDYLRETGEGSWRAEILVGETVAATMEVGD